MFQVEPGTRFGSVKHAAQYVARFLANRLLQAREALTNDPEQVDDDSESPPRA